MRDHEAELRAAWASEDAGESSAVAETLADRTATNNRRGLGGTIKDMDPADRPRERLIRLGADALSNAELVAILLSTGDREENALEKSRGLLQERGLVGLLRSDVQDLKRVTGLGEAKVTRIKAAVELAARGLADDEWPAREPFQTSKQVFDRYRGLLGDLTHEEVWVLVLDQQHCLIREERLYKGTVHGVTVRVSEMLRPVILHQGAAMIVVHNHPSGSPSPSRADRKLTSELVAGTRMMSIDFLDHVIVARSQFASMAELGLMDARFHEEAGEEQGSG
ncbi:MAG: DNA repair protein RadC [Chloroflexi bacterium]|nr:DNA repair protein RadC [Chloroflexota bacterium]MXX80445.1 DNA repair protein RadC [Chloroflexota bacterium]MYB22867.1 DNA repair protein RadC [Chloroflexota bacterium]MYD15974.1 DNA repair protein RadC [Chloroflexota bacterium]MYF22688.1 DNA repair protein RadC [Chloroflexota bacterium]